MHIIVYVCHVSTSNTLYSTRSTYLINTPKTNHSPIWQFHRSSHYTCHASLEHRFGSAFDTNKDLYIIIIMRNSLIFKIFGRAIFEVVEVNILEFWPQFFFLDNTECHLSSKSSKTALKIISKIASSQSISHDN